MVEEKTTFCIPLYNGKIKGKSRVNLKTLVQSMDSNVQKALVQEVLSTIGINLAITEEGCEFEVTALDKIQEYITWRKEKNAFNKALKLKTSASAKAENV